jgi:hypothetical protein
MEGFSLSEKRDSNSRPQPWQGCALPTELFSLEHCFLCNEADGKITQDTPLPQSIRQKSLGSL